MKAWLKAWGLLPLLLWAAGCAAPKAFVHEKVALAEQEPPPYRMAERNDLIELADCRIALDLESVPEAIGIPLEQYNPFDLNAKAHAKSAICPIRSVLRRVLEDGMGGVFAGGETVSESVIKLEPLRLDACKEGGSARCSMSFAVTIGGEAAGMLTAEQTMGWWNERTVPDSAYAAAADIGNRLLDFIAGSRQTIERIAAQRKGAGAMPTVARATFSEVVDNAFSGELLVDCGSWDIARAQRWARSQIEQIALSKLGVKTLENFRVVYDGGSDFGGSGGRLSIPFRVFPYQGFDLSYNAQTRRGVCAADLTVLGTTPEAAYERALHFVETVLSDQGVVKTAGKASAPAQFRFEGYRSTAGGTRIEIPFQLVQ